MKAKIFKGIFQTALMLVLGLVGIWYAADTADKEGDMLNLYIWAAMGAFWLVLLGAALIHVIIDPKDMVQRNEEDNPFYRYDHFLNRLGFFILRGIGFTVMFYYIGCIVAIDHDYLWVDLLAGAGLAIWLAVFNYINYDKDAQ